MGYASLRACVDDLERHGHLVRIKHPVDPNLELAEIQRRMYRKGSKAALFENVIGCDYPMLGNLFGSLERTKFIFRDTLDRVDKLVELKVDPGEFGRRPFRYWNVPFTALTMPPKRTSSGPVMRTEISLDRLPKLKSWPNDGGAFVTLPQVYTEDADSPGWQKSNLGMYRVQLDGNDYSRNREIGLHYQIHRGIGVHHSKAIARGEPLRVSVFVGGPPAMTVAAVMPLPEGLPELAFAGALGGRRVRLARSPIGCGVAAEADFVITGTVTGDRKKPEGPFGDHLGYYSLAHDFPVMEVEKVYARSDAIWPFTVVGRPPQEDTSFGALIHEITRPIIPTVIAGVKSVHAVDAAGVHPLLLALGSERYVPYERRRRPQELLTQSNAILGQGQLSLAKYLLIAAHEDDRSLDPHDEPAFFKHVLERLDPTRDLHFQTRTTVDTLDYSGTGFNEGSKLVIAAAGDKLRSLPAEPPTSINVPAGFGSVRRSTPGILIVGGPKWLDRATADRELETLAAALGSQSTAREYPLAVLVDDPDFVAADFNNFLWATFTRSDPATDVAGVDSFVEHKHWGCRGTIIIDARIKPKHAPPLVEDPAVSKRVDALAVANGPLHGLID